METKYPTPCERAPRENSTKMRGFLIGKPPRLSSPAYYPCPSAVSQYSLLRRAFSIQL